MSVAEPPPRRRILRLVAVGAVVAVVVYFLVGYVAQHRAAVAAFDWRFSPPALIGALAVLTVSILLVAEGWRRLLHATAGPGAHLPAAEAWQVWALGQTAKYVPGMIWPVAARVALTRRHGFPAGLVALSGLLEILLMVGSAVLVGLLTLPLQAGREAALAARLPGGIPAWAGALAVAAIGLLLLHPRLFRPLLSRLLRLARAGAPPADPSGRMFGLVGWYGATWCVHALGMAWFITAAVPTLGPADWPALGSAYVVAFIAGYLVVFLPMGLGVQEAVFAALTAPLFPDPAVAVVVCLGTRLALGSAELLALAAAAALRRTNLERR